MFGERIIGSGYKVEDGNIRFGLAGLEFGGHSKVFFECELAEDGFRITADNGLIINEKGPALTVDEVNKKLSDIAAASGPLAEKYFEDHQIHKGQPIRHKLGLNR